MGNIFSWFSFVSTEILCFLQQTDMKLITYLLSILRRVWKGGGWLLSPYSRNLGMLSRAEREKMPASNRLPRPAVPPSLLSVQGRGQTSLPHLREKPARHSAEMARVERMLPVAARWLSPYRICSGISCNSARRFGDYLADS